ncbi:ATP-dependent protease la, putative [Babesia ovata]|uniref:ATP-dependent protease la, putative n=1 Tax=Babesia ovata TaxID=189622 RepID=A0A2H6K784_9APIC|nr:ATP-dependent protease la, putative [Babesia ovata]GBE58838.1 ATP-dependent protease la, putative [Babesia ovata]
MGIFLCTAGLSFDRFVGFLKLFHKIVIKLYFTISFLNLPSRLCDSLLGRSLDLCLSFLVELFNGVGKFLDLNLKLVYYIAFKLIRNVGIHLIPHCLQPLVHGLGGAYIWVGALVGSSRRGELTVKLVCRCNSLIQRLCDVHITALAAHPVVGEHKGINLLAHLPGHSGECAHDQFGGSFLGTPFSTIVVAIIAVADAFGVLDAAFLQPLHTLNLRDYSISRVLELLIQSVSERLAGCFDSFNFFLNAGGGLLTFEHVNAFLNFCAKILRVPNFLRQTMVHIKRSRQKIASLLIPP